MLITKTKLGTFRCNYCKKLFETEAIALKHEEVHDYVLVPIAREDLNRLELFIYRKDWKLLSRDLMDIIKRYNQISSMRRYR